MVAGYERLETARRARNDGHRPRTPSRKQLVNRLGPKEREVASEHDPPRASARSDSPLDRGLDPRQGTLSWPTVWNVLSMGRHPGRVASCDQELTCPREGEGRERPLEPRLARIGVRQRRLVRAHSPAGASREDDSPPPQTVSAPTETLATDWVVESAGAA